jgi:hypothetical protein
MTTETTQEARVAAVERARRRVKAVREFWGHFWFYVMVNTVFVLIDLADGTEADPFLGLDWAYFPLIGWGAFVLAQFLSVFWFDGRFNARWEERKLQQYTELEQRRPSRPGAFATDDNEWC